IFPKEAIACLVPAFPFGRSQIAFVLFLARSNFLKIMLWLQITAPFATFTNSRSREYAASFPYPPPATIYGLLLSLVGEPERSRHRGVKLAIGFLPESPQQDISYLPAGGRPQTATVLRTFKRFKKPALDDPANSRPDYQEVLCGLNLVVGVDESEDRNRLAARIEQILENPETCDRFGGLSLGESRDLVDDVRILSQLPPAVRWLVEDAKGEALPTWVDYQGSQATRWEVLTLRASSQPAFCAISPSN
ncbi:MAG: type I-MYXAN CRISPR-associated protein Cas5/Cmx5/DevS, partial [Cyanobacteriota bacterium]|nr:type I-MYXAN CRISPR-associated protein Cas5/Cmx5/DevS [Cyanobacteriota bacterium]